MRKKFKKITSFLLIFTFVVAQLLPSIKVLADASLEEVGLTAKIKNPTTDEFVNIGSDYTFNYNGTNLTNYDLKITTNNYELENTNYLLVLDYEVYTINYENKIHSDSIRKALTKELDGKIHTDISLNALNFNGKMPISLKLYDITDIYAEFILSGEDVSTIDLTQKQAILTKTFNIYTTGYTNEIKFDSITYNDLEEVTYDNINNYYSVDASKSIINPVKVKHSSVLANADLLQNYYIHYNLNGHFLGFELVDVSMPTTKTLQILNSLVNGLYTLEIAITDIDGNEIAKNNIKLNLTNSSKTLTKEDLVKDSVLLEDIISYNMLSEEEKTNLNLSEEEITKLNNNLKKYSVNSYFETILNGEFGTKLSLNSYNTINGEEISTLYTYGTLNHIEATDNRISANDIINMLDEELKNHIILKVYDEFGNLVENDTYLKTNMTLEILSYGYKTTYKTAILGNLGSNDGYVKHDDIINIIDIAINSSKLDNIYHLVSDINGDEIIDILDVTDLMNLLKNGGIPFTSVENPIASNIKATLNPDKTEIRVGDEFELTLVVNNFENNKISGIEGIINYDETLIELLSVTNINDWYGNINVINDNQIGKFLTSGYTEINDEVAVLTYKFKALKEGEAKVYINNLKAALNGIEVTLANTTTNTVSVTVDRALSTNNNISKLEFNTGKLDKEFSKDILNYTLYVNYYTKSINISGLLEDANATTEAFKEYTLVGYKTTIEIPVKAEDGSIKTYIINVIKVDNRSSNNYLSNIDIDGVELSFDKNNLEYNITVLNNITKLTVIATAEDDKAEITIIGNNDLKVGKNVIEIKVKAENGSVRTYKINVEREQKEEVKEENNDNNTKLILIILIVATIAALAFLIFKDNNPKEEKDFKLKDRPYNKK